MNPCSSLWTAVLGALRGTVLELGPGAGARMPSSARSSSARSPTRTPRSRSGPAITRAGFDVLDLRSFDRAGTPQLAGAAERVHLTKGITL